MSTRVVIAFATCASLGLAAGLPRTGVRGQYIESRTADVYTGPCFANGEVNQVGDLAIMGWNIQTGEYQGVNLDGLSVVGVVKANNTLGGMAENVYPVKSVLIIDERANLEQRLALKSFAQHMGGDLFQQVVQIDYQPIAFLVKDGNIHTAEAHLKAGSLAEIATRALEQSDVHCLNSDVFYRPLTKTTHAMPAYTLANRFDGQGLNTRWSSPEKDSSFVGTFDLSE